MINVNNSTVTNLSFLYNKSNLGFCFVNCIVYLDHVRFGLKSQGTVFGLSGFEF